MQLGDWIAHFRYTHGIRRWTLCRLHRIDPATGRGCAELPCEEGDVGLAECSVRDQFVKATGRKLALARAMRAAGLTVAERTTLWRAYLERTGVLPTSGLS